MKRNVGLFLVVLGFLMILLNASIAAFFLRIFLQDPNIHVYDVTVGTHSDSSAPAMVIVIAGILILIGLIKIFGKSPTYQANYTQTPRPADVGISNVKYCSNCGQPVKDGTGKFCSNCGAKL